MVPLLLKGLDVANFVGTYGYTLNKSKMTREILSKNRCSEIIKLAQFWNSHVFYIVYNTTIHSLEGLIFKK